MNLYILKNKFSYILLVSALFLINFAGFGTGFFNNYNITIFLIYISLVVAFFYRYSLHLYIDGPFLKPIILIIFSITLSCYFSENEIFRNVWYRYFSIVTCIIFSFLMYVLIKENKIQTNVILEVLGFCSFLHVIILLCYWNYLEDPINHNWAINLPFFNNIRNFTDFIAIGFLCSLYLFFISENKINKILWSIITLVVLICIFWSGSRSSLLGILFCVICIFLFVKNKIENVLLLLFLSILSFYISTFFVVSNRGFGFANSIYRTTSGSLNEITSLRYDLYSKIVDYIIDKPVIGYGGEAVRNYIVNIYNIQVSQAHNFILQIIIEFGFLGLFSFAFFTVVYVRKINFLKLRENPIFAILICNIFISSIFNGGFYYISNLSLLCLFFSCLYFTCKKI